MLRRKDKEHIEHLYLSKFAKKSDETRGRKFPEEPCEFRTEFQRDRDRIIHSKAFKRLMNKTQVFIRPFGDHFRTRLTHTIEVSGISRTIANSLALNEDLTEAIALGHDLGHTPFGHSGEDVMNKIYKKGFSHNKQSLRVVETLELTKNRRGLNLTEEVRNGILNHTGKIKPSTLEGQIVKIADRIAYINHDIDDAIRAGIIEEKDLPKKCVEILGHSKTERINTLVKDMIFESDGKFEIMQSRKKQNAMNELRSFMTKEVYLNKKVKSFDAMQNVENIITHLYEYYKKNREEIAEEYIPLIDEDGIAEIAKDMVAGMTDRFAIKTYKDVFVPKY
ncbi:MAG: deoxyguanosinetriphosphate triphosphohydrolase [Clostridiales Family XIII bacterium]|jgi:dGTPase|nr:deoxyguanosinetriphosphate triphosphohydrolase [Clostridiales Family XIII bacterium]